MSLNFVSSFLDFIDFFVCFFHNRFRLQFARVLIDTDFCEVISKETRKLPKLFEYFSQMNLHGTSFLLAHFNLVQTKLIKFSLVAIVYKYTQYTNLTQTIIISMGKYVLLCLYSKRDRNKKCFVQLYDET